VTISQDRLLGRAAVLTAASMREVDEALAASLGLPLPRG
jgi:hypothetical protein